MAKEVLGVKYTGLTLIGVSSVITALVAAAIILFSAGSIGLSAYSLGLGVVLLVFAYFLLIYVK